MCFPCVSEFDERRQRHADAPTPPQADRTSPAQEAAARGKRRGTEKLLTSFVESD